MINYLYQDYSTPEKGLVVNEVMPEGFDSVEDFWEVVVEPSSCIASWIGYLFTELVVPANRYKSLVGRVRSVGGIFLVADKLNNLRDLVCESLEALKKGLFLEFGTKTADVYIQASATVDLVASFIQVGKDVGLYSLSVNQIVALNYIGFTGSLGLFLSSLRGIRKEAHDFWNKKIGSIEFKLALLNLLRKAFLLCLSVIMMITYLHGSVVSILVSMSITTTLLLCSLLSRYYKTHLELKPKVLEIKP